MAGFPERAAAADDHLLGTGRHLLHARRGRVLSQGSTQGRDASTELRPFRRGGLPADHRRQDEGLLSTRSSCLTGRGRILIGTLIANNRKICMSMIRRLMSAYGT